MEPSLQPLIEPKPVVSEEVNTLNNKPVETKSESLIDESDSVDLDFSLPSFLRRR